MLAVRRGKKAIELPERLVGPILRRVDRETWSAFLVLSRPVNLGVQFYTASYRFECSILATEAIKLSESLYIYHICCDLSAQPLPMDEVIYYEIYNAVSRESLSNDLAFASEKTCSFVIRDQANVLFGSCRKIHADRPDILAEIYDQQEQQGANHDERASLLVMAGDQIYADDVADGVLEYIQKWTDLLFDWTEPKFHKAVPKAGERKSYVKGLGLTTDKGDSHLIGFQEYVTMYLLAFSSSLWHVEGRSVDLCDESSKNACGIQEFIKSLPKLEKLWANTPTLMLIDDHDVTDDWNIHGAWYSKVWCDQAPNFECIDGARILSSAYMAGLIFQMLANGQMDRSYFKELTDLYSSYLQSESYDPFDAMALFHEVRELKGHSFVFSHNQRDYFMMLDTRTDRCFDGDSDEPAQLICPAKLEKLFNQSKNAERLIVLSPTPIFGFRKAEKVQQSWFWSRVLSPAKLDREAWSHNKEAFAKILDCLQEHKASEIICLGGDVHYAFADSVQFEGRQKRVLALTASPFKNLPTAYPVSKYLLNFLASEKVEQVKDYAVSYKQGILESSEETLVIYRPNAAVLNLADQDYYLLELPEDGHLVAHKYKE